MDIGKLLIAADTFFQGENSLTNHRKNVLSRAAFANAFRKHFRVVDIASVLGRDHSSIVHYKKTHSANMMYDDYIKLYKEAEVVRERILGEEIEQELTIGDMLITINKLKLKLKESEKEVNELSFYKDKYLKLKELIWASPSIPLLEFYLGSIIATMRMEISPPTKYKSA